MHVRVGGGVARRESVLTVSKTEGDASARVVSEKVEDDLQSVKPVLSLLPLP